MAEQNILVNIIGDSSKLNQALGKAEGKIRRGVRLPKLPKFKEAE